MAKPATSYMGGDPLEVEGETPEQKRQKKLALIRSKGMDIEDEAEDIRLNRKYQLAMRQPTTRPMPS
jgi:hypothetical protein